MSLFDLSRTAESHWRTSLASRIRIYPEEGGDHEFNLADFAGQLPACGDRIIKPRHLADDSGRIWEVVARYHDPGTPFDAGGCLRVVVRTRPPTDLEHAIMHRKAE